MKKFAILPMLALCACTTTGNTPNPIDWAAVDAKLNVVACRVSRAAAVGAEVAQAVSAKQAYVTGAGKVYTASKIVCASLGGTATAVKVP